MGGKTLQTNVRTLMNPHAPALHPGPLGRDMAVQLMTGLYSGIPVIDREGTVLGIVTQSNLAAVLGRGKDFSILHTEEVMTVLPDYLHVDMTREEVGSILIQRNLMQLPVVCDGKMAGVMTRWIVFGKDELRKEHVKSEDFRYSGITNPTVQRGSTLHSSRKIQSVKVPKTLFVVADDPGIVGMLCDDLGDMGAQFASLM